MNSILFLAAVICFPSAEMSQRLMSAGQGTVVAYGADNRNLLAKVYSNPETRVWTITLTNSEGKSCLVDYGVEWRSLEQQDDEK